jgi:hypothetical protein
MSNTRVSPSPIHGKGLFARLAFVTGERVEGIEGNIILGESRSKYAIMLRGGRSLVLTGKAKWINHSREPNVRLDLKKGVIAIRDIAEGEELFSRYESIF